MTIFNCSSHSDAVEAADERAYLLASPLLGLVRPCGAPLL